jgi:hypothetical protein
MVLKWMDGWMDWKKKWVLTEVRNKNGDYLIQVGSWVLHRLEMWQQDGFQQASNLGSILRPARVLGGAETIGKPSQAGHHRLAVGGALGGGGQFNAGHLAEGGACGAAEVVHIHPHCTHHSYRKIQG